MSVPRFRRLVWAGAFVYLAYLVGLMIYGVPRTAWASGVDVLLSLSFFILGVVTAWKRLDLRFARLCTLSSFVEASAFLWLAVTQFYRAGCQVLGRLPY